MVSLERVRWRCPDKVWGLSGHVSGDVIISWNGRSTAYSFTWMVVVTGLYSQCRWSLT